MEIEKSYSFFPESSMITDLKKTRKSLPDSSIFRILERKTEWANMTIVADLTGSMSPYTTQLVLWFKLKANDKRVKDLVFFNDGDSTPHNKKILGHTGGIYYSKAVNYDSIRALALKTIFAGGGGDGPENNIEALLYAIDKSPKANDIIMVADNTAPVKDISLLYALKKPIHIILCGTSYGINPQYLTIARQTGGSIHTMEKDLEDLVKKNEGESFEFLGEKFTIIGGVVVKVRRM